MVSVPEIAPALSLRGVTMNYNEFRALTDVDLAIKPGEIHAIVGEHGAGKSSLAMIMSGYLKPRSGAIDIYGHPYPQYSLKLAQSLGVRMVYQQTYLNEHFSVAENLFYTTRSSTRFGLYSRARVEERAREYLRTFGFSIDPRIELRSLSLSERTVIELLKNFYMEPRILILDETLEKLSTESFDRIVPILLEMRDNGASIVTITHRIDDVYRLANRVTVLKTGTRLFSDRVDNINKLNLVRMAYTQVSADSTQVRLDTEFYQFLKYNEAILQHLPVNIVVVDEDLRIKMVNEHCVTSFGLADGEYINGPIDKLLASNPGAMAMIRESAEARQAKTFYNIELRINDTTSVNNVTTYPVYDGHIVIGTIIIIEDMTEYDQLQRQLILSEKLASVGLLAAGVAHEINNPLEIISNYLNYIRYTQEPAEVTDSMDKVKREIDYISKIVSNLLTFSGHRTPGRELVDLNEVIGEILDLLKYNAEYKHITISFTRSDDEPRFLGDRDQIKQVVLNLIKNSFEAMPEGGSIRVRTDLRQTEDSTWTRLVFEDTGPGIDAEDPNSIFLPFFSTKSAGGNTLGLGLSISYRIIESFHGTMTVENIRDGGCRFTIDLPRAATPEAPETVPASES